MEEVNFKRLQIAGLFIISFLGGMVHMALALLASVAGLLEISEMEMMSEGMLYIMVLWFAAMIAPAILPLLTEKRAWRWVTAIVGLVMTVMGIVDSISHMTMPGQLPLGLSGLIIGSIPGIIAVVLAFRWARAKE